MEFEIYRILYAFISSKNKKRLKLSLLNVFYYYESLLINLLIALLFYRLKFQKLKLYRFPPLFPN